MLVVLETLLVYDKHNASSVLDRCPGPCAFMSKEKLGEVLHTCIIIVLALPQSYCYHRKCAAKQAALVAKVVSTGLEM